MGCCWNSRTLRGVQGPDTWFTRAESACHLCAVIVRISSVLSLKADDGQDPWKAFRSPSRLDCWDGTMPSTGGADTWNDRSCYDQPVRSSFRGHTRVHLSSFHGGKTPYLSSPLPWANPSFPALSGASPSFPSQQRAVRWVPKPSREWSLWIRFSTGCCRNALDTFESKFCLEQPRRRRKSRRPDSLHKDGAR